MALATEERKYASQRSCQSYAEFIFSAAKFADLLNLHSIQKG